jgi:phosphorylcholine metabolism protein LicD
MKEFILILFVITVIYILWMLCLWYRKNVVYPKVVKSMKMIHPNITKMMIDIQPYLEQNDITYFITSGTLLGYMRNGKFIKYDDDIDLGIINSDDLKEKIEAFEKDISLIGYKIKKKFFGWQIHFNNPEIKGYIDLFIFEEKDGKITLNKEGIKHWPNEYFYHDELYPLNEGIFENIKVKIPNQPINYINSFYGNEALNQYVFTHCHQGSFFDKWLIFFSNKLKKFYVEC